MGTQEGERDWVDVANNLLSKCHVNLRLKKLTDCSADVFITLYENILGEKVPDYIGESCSQEDDVHNVQSVIDSLSLDYLQISLSHITGENVVRGNAESIKNLLEIFDGLLEYLNEEIEDAVEDVPPETKESTTYDPPELKEKDQDGASGSSSAESGVLSSRNSLWCCQAKEKRSSHKELFSLGASAHTFPNKQQDAAASPDPVESEEAWQTLPTYSAIALQPPNQHDGASMHPQEAPGTEKTSNLVAETVTTNGLQSASGRHSPTVSDTSSAIQRRTTTEVEGETLEPTNGGPRKVLFRTQPDVLFLTLQDEIAPTTRSPPDTEEEQEEREGLASTRTLKDRTRKDGKDVWGAEEASTESLSNRRQRNMQAEEELHHISENLSHRLKELDQMLKQVLGESYESIEVKDEDKRSHHSDSVMDLRRRRSGSPGRASVQRTRSLSPSSPQVRRRQREDHRAKTPSPGRCKQTNLGASSRSRREEQLRAPKPRKHTKGVKIRGAEEELRRFEAKKRTQIDVARLKAQQAEREYREAILGDVSQAPRRPPAKTKTQCRPQRRPEATRRAPSLKIRDNQLLPLLREELPHLHIAPRVLGRMWEQQMQQVDRLHATSSSHIWGRTLCNQFEEAQNKHHLLLELVRKDKEHSRRLREFKERIQQQKSTQNKLREQRQQVALAKKYHSEYHVQHRARLMRARTKEERVFRQLFEEGLELQKVQLKEQRAMAREQRAEHQRRHEDQITSMENYYRDQFSLIAEKLAQEREEIQVRKKAQEKALLKMKRELRSRMEREIGELQRIIVENDEDDHFQELEVQRLRNRVQMASFQYNTSYLH